MERIRADFEQIWENMTAEQQQAYGRQYIDRHITEADASRWGGNTDISPVTVTLTDALFSVKPPTRCIVHGGSGKIDLFSVSWYFPSIFTYCWFNFCFFCCFFLSKRYWCQRLALRSQQHMLQKCGGGLFIYLFEINSKGQVPAINTLHRYSTELISIQKRSKQNG